MSKRTAELRMTQEWKDTPAVFSHRMLMTLLDTWEVPIIFFSFKENRK